MGKGDWWELYVVLLPGLCDIYPNGKVFLKPARGQSLSWHCGLR